MQVIQATHRKGQVDGAPLMTDQWPLIKLHHHVNASCIRGKSVASISLLLMPNLAGKALRSDTLLPDLAEARQNAAPVAGRMIDSMLGGSFLAHTIDKNASPRVHINLRATAQTLLLLSGALNERNMSCSVGGRLGTGQGNRNYCRRCI